MSWTDSVSFLGGANFIDHEVNGSKVRFYPISVATLFKLRALGKPLAKALAIIMGDGSAETSLTNESIKDKEGAEVYREVVEAIAADLLREKFSLREETIYSVIDAFTAQESADLIGQVIVESIKDEFEDGQAPPGKHFMKALDVGTLAQLLAGVIKANSGALSPVTEGNVLAPLAGAGSTAGDS